MKVNILGTLVDDLTLAEVLERVGEWLEGTRGEQIVTANPEIVLRAYQDKNYQKILNQAALVVPDGWGLLLAAKINGQKIRERVVGVELVEKLMAGAAQKGYKVYLLGGAPGIALKAADYLSKKYPLLKIVGMQEGMSPQEFTLINENLVSQIKQKGPDILLVAFGAPKQEKWLAYNLTFLPSVKVAIGVGGTFDYWSGKIKRAPLFLRERGLEWLWRLWQQPQRWSRITSAVFIFTFLVCKERFKLS